MVGSLGGQRYCAPTSRIESRRKREQVAKWAHDPGQLSGVRRRKRHTSAGLLLAEVYASDFLLTTNGRMYNVGKPSNLLLRSNLLLVLHGRCCRLMPPSRLLLLRLLLAMPILPPQPLKHRSLQFRIDVAFVIPALPLFVATS